MKNTFNNFTDGIGNTPLIRFKVLIGKYEFSYFLESWNIGDAMTPRCSTPRPFNGTCQNIRTHEKLFRIPFGDNPDWHGSCARMTCTNREM